MEKVSVRLQTVSTLIIFWFYFIFTSPTQGNFWSRRSRKTESNFQTSTQNGVFLLVCLSSIRAWLVFFQEQSLVIKLQSNRLDSYVHALVAKNFILRNHLKILTNAQLQKLGQAVGWLWPLAFCSTLMLGWRSLNGKCLAIWANIKVGFHLQFFSLCWFFSVGLTCSFSSMVSLFVLFVANFLHFQVVFLSSRCITTFSFFL